jgi:hypothetical protein
MPHNYSLSAMVKNKKITKKSTILYCILQIKSLSTTNSTNSVKINESIGKIFFLQYWGYKAKKYPQQIHDEDSSKKGDQRKG